MAVTNHLRASSLHANQHVERLKSATSLGIHYGKQELNRQACFCDVRNAKSLAGESDLYVDN